MVSAPVRTRFEQVGSPVPRSPLSVVVIAVAGQGATLTPNEVTEVTESTKAAMGTDGMMLLAYNYLTRHTAPHFYALPYAHSADAATLATNIRNAITALGSDDERVKFTHSFNRPSFAVMPNVGPDSVAANAAITQLKALASDSSLRIAGVFVDGRSATQADAVTWLGNNAGDGLISVMNSGGSVPGSIIAASQWTRYLTATNLGLNPIGIDYPVDSPAPTPAWSFLPDSQTAAAVALARAYGTSIITYNGNHYLWGGKINASVEGSPFESVGARLVTFQMADRIEAEMLRYNHTRLTLARRERLFSTAVLIAQEYINLGEAADVALGTPTLSAGLLSMSMSVSFDEVVRNSELVVSVQHTEG